MSEAKQFIWSVRVYHEDIDTSGIVYYANYLKFMERARTEWLRSLGFDQSALRDDEGLVFAVSRATVEYLKPARFGDALAVGVKIARCGRASMELVQNVCLESGEMLCRAQIRIACVDFISFRPRAIPTPILSELQV